jgi:hypothetical protein
MGCLLFCLCFGVDDPNLKGINNNPVKLINLNRGVDDPNLKGINNSAIEALFITVVLMTLI